jgi:hypothetical protein
MWDREPKKYRDWRQEAREKREERMTFIRQVASGSRKKLPKAQRSNIEACAKVAQQ